MTFASKSSIGPSYATHGPMYIPSYEVMTLHNTARTFCNIPRRLRNTPIILHTLANMHFDCLCNVQVLTVRSLNEIENKKENKKYVEWLTFRSLNEIENKKENKKHVQNVKGPPSGRGLINSWNWVRA